MVVSASWGLLGQIGLFFLKAGAFVFGSGLAIVPFLYSEREPQFEPPQTAIFR